MKEYTVRYKLTSKQHERLVKISEKMKEYDRDCFEYLMLLDSQKYIDEKLSFYEEFYKINEEF